MLGTINVFATFVGYRSSAVASLIAEALAGDCCRHDDAMRLSRPETEICSARRRSARLTRLPWLGAGIAAAMVLSGVAIATQDPLPGAAMVTQKNRSFQPGSVELQKSQVLRIVNDDGQLSHHAYVASGNFDFDSGEQMPGDTVDIRFPALGSYVVLCGIHPKMRLSVTVR